MAAPASMPDPTSPASHRAFAWFVIGPGLAVVGSCAACIGVAVIPNLRAAQHDRAEMDLLSIRNALQLYLDHHHAYPPISGRLDVLVSERILDELPADPFGHPTRTTGQTVGPTWSGWELTVPLVEWTRMLTFAWMS